MTIKLDEIKELTATAAQRREERRAKRAEARKQRLEEAKAVALLANERARKRRNRAFRKEVERIVGVIERGIKKAADRGKNSYSFSFGTPSKLARKKRNNIVEVFPEFNPTKYTKNTKEWVSGGYYDYDYYYSPGYYRNVRQLKLKFSW